MRSGAFIISFNSTALSRIAFNSSTSLMPSASAKTLKSRPDVIRRFLIGFVKACKYIADGKNKWTPEEIAIFAKYSKLPTDVIAAIPTPPYTGEFGTIHTAELEKLQRFWHTYGLVNIEQPISALVDTSFITAAQKAAGVGR